jgi:tyrosyl-tRNA synthetase
MDLVDLLVTTRLAANTSDARRLIRSAKARLNGRVVAHEGVTAGLADLDDDGLLRLATNDVNERLVRAA